MSKAACTASNHPIRIMLVDDHRTMLWGLEKLIEGEAPAMELAGCAMDCEQARVVFEDCRPDVVLLDLDLGGQSALCLIPEMSGADGARVLVLTAGRNPDELDEAVLRGARGILDKRVAAEQVIKAIHKVHAGELWLDGARMSRLLSAAAKPRRAEPEQDPLAALTERERAVVASLLEQSGAPNKTVARRLFISEHTLRNHLSSIYQKLGVANRLELYVYVSRQGRQLRPRQQPQARY